MGHKIRLLPWADVAVPSLASGLFITRIGCYLFGCDFGRRLSPCAPGWLQKMGRGTMNVSGSFGGLGASFGVSEGTMNILPAASIPAPQPISM